MKRPSRFFSRAPVRPLLHSLEPRLLFAAGDLDVTFGGDGKVTTDFPGAANFARAAALHAGGKVLVAGATGNSGNDPTGELTGGDFLVARFDAINGKLDTSFGGGDGFVATDFGTRGDIANDVAVLPDGRFVVVGGTLEPGAFPGLGAVAVARYRADGALDPTFGGGDGRVVVNVPFANLSRAYAVAPLADGKLLMAGFAEVHGAAGTAGTNGDFLVLRLNPDGSLDPTFGAGGSDGDGIVTTDASGTGRPDTAMALALLPGAGGDFVVGGRSGQLIAGESSGIGALVRYNADGTIDPAFAPEPNTAPPGAPTAAPPGVVYTYGSDAVAVTPGGKIVSAGRQYVARYNADGSFDRTFDDGLVEVTVTHPLRGGSEPLSINDLDLLPSGDVLVAGAADYDAGAIARITPAGVIADRAAYYQVGHVWGTVPLPGGGIFTAGKTPSDFYTQYRQELQDFGLAHLTAGLDLDTSGPFGEPGSMFVPPGTARFDFGASDAAVAVAPAPGGKIIVVGTSDAPHGPLISRYNADGSLDTAFGDRGRALGEFGRPRVLDAVGAAAILADGSILVAGRVRGDFGVARYTAAGRLDGSFGDAGVKRLNFNTDNDAVAAMAVLPDGRIVLAGRGSNDFAFARLLPNGQPDPTFGDGNGKRTVDFGAADDAANAVAVMPDGRIVAAGTSGRNFAVVRLLADGRPDPAFSGDGKVTVNFGGADVARAVALLPGGKVLAAGSGGVGSSPDAGGDFAVARFNADGSRDASFGRDGVLTTDLGGAARSNALAVLPGGRFVVAGTTRRGAVFPGQDNPAAGVFADKDFALVAYNADGTRDSSFGDDSRVITDFFARSADAANAVALDADGRLLVAGASDGDFAVARYLTGGTPPPPPPPPEDIVLQAEDATLVGAVVRRSWPGYQGTGYADYVNSTGDYVEWAFDVPVAGNYAVLFRYANGSTSERPMRMEVNGRVSQFGQGFAPTGSWQTWSTFDTSVFFGQELRAGRNVIRLTASGASGPNVDALIVRPLGDPQQPPPPQTLQAEQAELRGPVVRSQHGGFTGSGYADFVAPAGESIRFAVNVDQRRTDRLEFRYANGSTSSRPLALAFNDATLSERLKFRPTGSWSTWGTETVLLGLLPGVTFITLTSEGASGANIDSLTVRAI